MRAAARRNKVPTARTAPLPWDGINEFGIDRAEWEQRARATFLAITALEHAFPPSWRVEQGVATRDELMHEILGIIWVARHDPDERVAAYHILRKAVVLQQLYLALSQLDAGEVHPLLRPRHINNRPRASTKKTVVMAILAATYSALTLLGASRSEASRKVAAMVMKRWRHSDRTPVTGGMVYRYWRRLRGSLEFECLQRIILSGGRYSWMDWTASRSHLFDPKSFNPTESSVMKEAAATLDQFLAASGKLSVTPLS